MKLTCIAIDDEPLALDIISSFCERFGNIDLLTFTNPIEGMEAVNNVIPDILFLDIRMRGINGVELAKRLPAGINLIFTTAYKEYALDGFELEALDYIQKPFSYKRFIRGLQKVWDKKTQESINPDLSDESITLKVDYKDYILRLRDIIYVESFDSYVRLHTTMDDCLMTQISMKRLEELLPEDKFIRVHKSFIVPVYRIMKFNNKEITLHNGTIIPIGRTYLNLVRSHILE